MSAKPRKILPPATGKCGWMGVETNGNPILGITPAGGEQTVYEAEQVFGGWKLHHIDKQTGEIVTYVVDQLTDGVNWTCSCPDAANRPERKHACKHVRALKACEKVCPVK